MRFKFGLALAIAATGLSATTSLADELAFDGRIPPSAEAYARGESERLEAVRRQIQLNDAMRWRAGLPPANGVFYYPSPHYEPGFAFPRSYPFGFVPTTKQPVGRIEIQTGPNRWESHPVYAAPPAPPPLPAQHERVEVIPDETPPAVEGPREF